VKPCNAVFPAGRKNPPRASLPQDLEQALVDLRLVKSVKSNQELEQILADSGFEPGQSSQELDQVLFNVRLDHGGLTKEFEQLLGASRLER
jgi:hypothetical protein